MIQSSANYLPLNASGKERSFEENLNRGNIDVQHVRKDDEKCYSEIPRRIGIDKDAFQ